ncbi:hypothetical protein [Paenibacillus sp. oral taxon 786]|nr:hypothetical protein [Paenibacillus sp. oral taxon 786]
MASICPKNHPAGCPLAWSAEQARIAAFTQRDAVEITIDVEILMGIKEMR